MKKMLKLVSVICLLAITLATFATVVGAAEQSGTGSASTASTTVDPALATQNAKYLVMYLEYLSDYDTEASWEENYDTLLRIVTKARELVKADNYDKSYKNLATLLEEFKPINAYFYGKLQAEHIAYITALNATFESSNLYIEKLGICSEIKKYAETADIDPENTELAALISANEQRLASMDDLKDSYIAGLYANADLFVAKVAELDSTKTYNQIVAIIDAASAYYYGMVIDDTENSTEEQVMAAVATYDAYIVYLAETLEYSEDFKLIVAALKNETSYPRRYQLISEACKIVDLISDDIDGVSAARASYTAAYNDYMTLTNSAKAELVTTQSSVATLRSKWGAADILALFAELVGFVID